MTLDGELIKTVLPIWGAGLSTMLGLVKAWEVFWRDRLRIETSYSFVGNDDPDTIIVVNLSNKPVQVSHWTLTWSPTWFRFWIETIDATPDEGGASFFVGAHSQQILTFSDHDKIPSSYNTTRGRKLVLRLHIFGRSRIKKLKVYPG